MKKKNKNMYNDSGIIFVMILVILGASFFVVGAYDSYRWMKRPKMEVSLSSCSEYPNVETEDKVTYDGYFNYVVEGTEYKATAEVTANECKKGTRRTVYYNANKPDEYRVGDMLVAFIMFSIFAAIFIIIPIIIIISCLKPKKKES